MWFTVSRSLVHRMLVPCCRADLWYSLVLRLHCNPHTVGADKHCLGLCFFGHQNGGHSPSVTTQSCQVMFVFWFRCSALPFLPFSFSPLMILFRILFPPLAGPIWSVGQRMHLGWHQYDSTTRHDLTNLTDSDEVIRNYATSTWSYAADSSCLVRWTH